jgi:hypothetical protein
MTNHDEEAELMTEIEIETRDGRPWGFRATVAELEEAFAAIPDDVLVEAFEHQWMGRGLEPPALTVKQLRDRVLAAHKQTAKRLPRERLLTVTEAAPHLGLTERQLRHAVDQGDYDDDLTTFKDGRRALRFQTTGQNWKLSPRHLGPDPRVLVHMVEAGIGPGESFEFGYHGSEHSETYMRLADGENWRESW